MFELIFLGTSASAPSVHRGLSAQVVMHDEYRFLIDCGEGTQRQILQSGIGFKRLNRILITHGHLDHILGLAGLLSTFSRWEAIDELEIFAGGWALERIRDLLYGVVLRGARPPMDIQLREHGVMLLLGSMRAEERLATFLLNLVQRLHARGFSQSELILRMTREEIGSFLGLKLETVSRTFSKFVEEGIVEVKQRHVRIMNTDALRDIVNPKSCT